MSTDERRRDVRARISLPIYVVRRGSQEQATMLDASYRGLFLRMEEAPPVRQLMKLRIALPPGVAGGDGKNLILHAVVVRIVDDELGRAGVGFRFFALNGQDRADWENFLATVIRARSRAA